MSDDQGVTSLPVISRNNAEHYAWGTGCDGWHLVKDSGLSVIEECMPAGASEVSHCHRKSRQSWRPMAGRFLFPWANALFLVMSRPPSHEDRARK
jgi:hypothetical protein